MSCSSIPAGTLILPFGNNYYNYKNARFRVTEMFSVICYTDKTNYEEFKKIDLKCNSWHLFNVGFPKSAESQDELKLAQVNRALWHICDTVHTGTMAAVPTEAQLWVVLSVLLPHYHITPKFGVIKTPKLS